MEQLMEKLFESTSKVRVMRLFIQNPETSFTFPKILQRTQIKKSSAKKELIKLTKIGLIETKIATIKKEESPNGVKEKSKKMQVYHLNQQFPLLNELHALMVKSSTTSRKKILNQIKKLGKVKLAILSGIFINSDRSRTDLLIVGDDISKKRLENFLVEVESELGKTLSYTVMDTDEFRYRMNMLDRFLRDIFEYPHEKLINKMNLR